MAWTTLSFPFGSILTSSKMTQLYDNFAAFAAKDSGAPVLADDYIVAAMIATGAVTADGIASGAVDTSELATDSVTAAKIAAGAVGTSEIATNGVGAAEISAGAVGQSEIGSGAVHRAELDTATASTSGNVGAGDGDNVTLNAYAFFPMIQSDQDTKVGGHPTDSGADNPRFRIEGEASTNWDVDHRYVIA